MRTKVAVLLVALVLGAVACGKSEEPRARNASTLVGSVCKKPGAIKKVGRLSYVCGSVRSSKPKQGIYYGVAKVRDWKCAKLGVIRFQNGILSVCSGGSKVNRRRWAMTTPMPYSPGTLIGERESTTANALEAVGIAIPEGLRLDPSATTIVGNVATTTGSTTTIDSRVSSSTSVNPSPSVVPSSSLLPVVTSVDPVPPEPDTPQASVEIPGPPAAVDDVVSCAEGGTCATGDTGPAGGVVVVVNFMLSEPPTLIEVAPVTWFGVGRGAQSFVDNLVFGGFSDWRLPTSSEALTMRRDRALFRCPGENRCARGFANAPYWISESDGFLAIDFASVEAPTGASPKQFRYARPVRVLAAASGGIQVELEPS